MSRIDIAVPCYNYGSFLPDCLDSILEQDGIALRVLVIDNASTDDSVEVAQEYARRDDRVSVVRHARNLGPTASYNEGVDWASADYFLLIDADDVVTPGALGRAVSVLDDRSDLAFACGLEVEATFGAGERARLGLAETAAACWTFETGAAFIRRQCDFDRIIGSPTVVRRTAVQKAAGYYRAELPFSDDIELWLRLARLGNVAISDVPQAIRRRHGRQVTEGYRVRRAYMFRELLKAYESFFANDARDMPEARELLAGLRKRTGHSALYNGRSMAGDREGAALLRLALELTPAFALPRIARHVLSVERPLAELRLLMGADAPGT